MADLAHTLTDADLAALALLDRSVIWDRGATLPPAATVRHGQGRPHHVRDLDAVLAWAAERTAHLSDERCRLALALRLN